MDWIAADLLIEVPDDAVDDGSSKGDFVVVFRRLPALCDTYRHWTRTLRTVGSAWISIGESFSLIEGFECVSKAPIGILGHKKEERDRINEARLCMRCVKFEGEGFPVSR
jgi:hypothetical protein